MEEKPKMDDEEEGEEVELKESEPTPLCSTIDAEKIQVFLDAATRLADEGTISFEEDGMRIREMDASQIAMVDAFIPKACFTLYPASQGKLGVNLQTLKKFLAKASGQVELKVVENRLHINFSKKEFVLSLLDLSNSTRKVPKIEGFEFSIGPSVLFGAIKDCWLVSAHISFENKENILHVIGTGDAGEADIKTEIAMPSPLTVMFPVDFLGKMNLSGDTMKVMLKKNSPLRLTYDLDKVLVMYWLAPRIEPE